MVIRGDQVAAVKSRPQGKDYQEPIPNAGCYPEKRVETRDRPVTGMLKIPSSMESEERIPQ
jgi:hypothetical protein